MSSDLEGLTPGQLRQLRGMVGDAALERLRAGGVDVGRKPRGRRRDRVVCELQVLPLRRVPGQLVVEELPPSLNRLWRARVAVGEDGTPRIRWHRSGRYMKWKKWAETFVAPQWLGEPLGSDVSIEFWLAVGGDVQAGHEPDLDNVMKIVLDVLQGFAFKNDRQVVDVELHRRFVPEFRSRLYVRIKPADGRAVAPWAEAA